MSHMKPQIEAFTQYTGDEYEVCPDCYYCIANGPPDSPDPSWDADSMCEANLTSKSLDDAGNEFLNEGEFSHSGCECCNSSLGGTRYTCVDIDSVEAVKKYRWRLSAPGYLDSTDWSVADSLLEAIDDMLGMHGDEFDDCDNDTIGELLDDIAPGCWEQFKEGYLLGLAFTATRYSSEDDEGDSAFGEGGCDIADCVDVDSDIWEHLTDEQKQTISSDCLGFLLSALGVIADPETWEDSLWHSLGSDFHLTRNGHGAGLWDGDWDHLQPLDPSKGDLGKQLTELARPYGSAELHVYGQHIDAWEVEGWEGSDACLETSFFEYGLVWKLSDDKTEYRFRYPSKYREDTDIPTHYQWGCIATDCNVLTEFNWIDWESDLSPIDVTTLPQFVEWCKQPLPQRIYDLVQLFGTENVFGTDYTEGNPVYCDETISFDIVN